MGTREGDAIRLRVRDNKIVITGELWPHRQRSNGLQKGAILTTAVADIAGEEVGFGTPVAFICGSFVYSTHAKIEQIDKGARKTFEMDAVSTKRWKSRLLSGFPGPDALFDGWLIGNLSPLYRSRGLAQVVANGF